MLYPLPRSNMPQFGLHLTACSSFAVRLVAVLGTELRSHQLQNLSCSSLGGAEASQILAHICLHTKRSPAVVAWSAFLRIAHVQANYRAVALESCIWTRSNYWARFFVPSTLPLVRGFVLLSPPRVVHLNSSLGTWLTCACSR